MVNWLCCLSWLLLSCASAAADLDFELPHGWRLGAKGQFALHGLHDSTRSYFESLGNRGVERRSGPRFQSSIRYSRFSLTLTAPEVDVGVRPRVFFEWDFAGGRPARDAEVSQLLFRVRQLYVAVDREGWTWTGGQAWSLFGWNPFYLPSTVSVAPGPATPYQRRVQATGVRHLGGLDLGFSVAQPSQRDSGQPDLDVGARGFLTDWRGSVTSAAGPLRVESASLAVSATRRVLRGRGEASRAGFGLAYDAFVPLGSRFSFLGSYVHGAGLAAALPGWTGGVAGDEGGGVDLPPGQGGFDDGGAFRLVDLETWNLQVQGFVSPGWIASVGVAHVGAFALDRWPGSGRGGAESRYHRLDGVFVNVLHDVFASARVAVEYSAVRARYVDGVVALNERWQGSFYFRF